MFVMQHRLVSMTTAALLTLSACSHSPLARARAVADKTAIHAADLAWASDWASRDLEKIVSHYADDAVVALPGWQVLVGKNSLRASLQKMFGPQYHLVLGFTPQSSAWSSGTTRPGTYWLIQRSQTDPTTWIGSKEIGHYGVNYRKLANGAWVVTHQWLADSGPETILPSWFQETGSQDIYSRPKDDEGRPPGPG